MDVSIGKRLFCAVKANFLIISLGAKRKLPAECYNRLDQWRPFCRRE